MPGELRMFFRAARIAGTAGILFLGACSAPPEPFPDFCEEQNRVIPREERIVAALAFVGQEGISPAIPHFFEFHREKKRQNQTTSDRAIAEAYFAAHPDCCDVVPPWVVTRFYDDLLNPTHRDALRDFFEHHRGFHWSHDVVIAHSPPIGSDPDPYRVQSSSCGVAEKLS